ncbi:EAL domain-containing protein [Janthinobacterium sp. 17J80-10]|uniref:bifunctional diguanylate cyclase/phosphodiesterase n=1 Tax=Janthinobacterium sp. 17J80-10 TaxID=2497863 RepID=UPI0010056170|nr:EAL domain-containing protein [Janthinobacterium sp. 17J80-10]QAU35125.1 EAL domain-containing protein [Janthinobacterium sp. 17J80-10]
MTKIKSFRAPWSVRSYLLCLVLACLLPGVLGAAALFIFQYQESRTQLQKNTILTARALVQTVDHQLLSVQAVAQTLATSEALRLHDLAVFHQQARAAMKQVGLGNNVVLRDMAGRQILNTAVEFRTPLAPTAAPDQVRDIFASGKPKINDMFVGPVLKRPVMSVDVPVIIDGKVSYALGVGVLPEHFDRILKSQRLPPDWLVVIVDSAGTIIARSHASERFINEKASPDLLKALQRAPEGGIKAITKEGVSVLSFFSESPVTHWRVAIGIPRDTVENALAQTLSLLALGVASLFGVGLFLAWFMGGKIAFSVRALTAPASALGSGATVEVPPLHIQEAAEVAAAIGRAANLLNEHSASLRDKELELAEAHRLAKFGTWHWDARTDAITTSQSVPTIFGEEIHSFAQTRGTLLSEDTWQMVNEATNEAVRTGTGYDLELTIQRRDGAVICLHSKCQAVWNQAHVVIGLRGTVQDITERKKAEEKLRESEERFRLVADNITQLAWITDGEGQPLWLNRRFLEFTGTTLESMKNKGWRKLHHPDHLDDAIVKFGQHLTSGEPWEDTFPMKGADGQYRWFLSRAISQRDASGRIVRWFGTNTDITALRDADEELQKFKFFSDCANDGLMLLDQQGHILYANKLACERLGYSEQDMLRLNISAIDPQHTAQEFAAIFARSKQHRIPPFEGVHQRRDGTTLTVETAVAVLEHKGEWLMFATARDITERKQAELRVREAALHDPLTSLPNRALVFEYCGRLLAAARRNHSRGALMFIDLDRFKPVNDLYGHETGDRLLQEVASRLVDCVRDEDLVGRIGGDEFVVVLPYIESERERVARVAQHVCDSLEQPFRIDGLELTISASIGISYFPDHATEVSTLLHAADLAMYLAKQSGRANYQFYTPGLEERAEQTLLLEVRLKQALKQGTLKLHYQPVIDIRSGQLAGAEALVRLADEHGVESVGPATFIPVAESTGLIGELGEWALQEACRQQMAWRRAGLTTRVAINVSPLQFRQRGFAERLSEIIASSGIDPACLEIEVTESAVMENVSDAIELLRKIKMLGVRVALDDFGTGYSSLSSLSNLPLDKLKVDQSFVRRIERDKASRSVTEAIIALARSLNLQVVGEGIESEFALHYLARQGCNLAQGYWFSRPLPPDEFFSWYRNRTDDRRLQLTGQA